MAAALVAVAMVAVLGRGGQARVAEATGLSRKTLNVGAAELAARRRSISIPICWWCSTRWSSLSRGAPDVAAAQHPGRRASRCRPAGVPHRLQEGELVGDYATAGAQLGASLVDRIMVNLGTISVRPSCLPSRQVTGRPAVG
ncbi:MAG: hypothetical protein ACKVWR_18955 [Acidimicrobiales bacterium]